MPSDFSEKTLELLIMNNLDKISERGFPSLHKYTVNQFPLPSGKFIDILSIDIQETTIYCRVFELKKEQLNMDAFIQLMDYSTELFIYLSPHFQYIALERYLVGTDYNQDIKVITESLPEVSVYLYKYDFNGVFFKKSECIYDTKNPGVVQLLNKPSPHSAELLAKILKICGQWD